MTEDEGQVGDMFVGALWAILGSVPWWAVAFLIWSVLQ